MPSDATATLGHASTATRRPAWAAVVSMSLGVFALVTAEFLPASLLTPMAEGLRISEGLAGQAVTATAMVALLTSLGIGTVARNLDRRIVLMTLSVLLIASNLIVATAPGFAPLLLGRVLMGVALGGFWSLSIAIVVRLVPEDAVPRALSIVFLGVSAATVVAVPVGSYLGGLIGWRGVFYAAAALGGFALLVQALTLPSLPARSAAGPGTMLAVLRRPDVGVGMVAVLLVFAGHFTFFTYLRPFLEQVTGVGIEGISAILLGFGIANFAGTYLIAFLIERSLKLAILLMPLVMAVLVVGLILFGGAPWGAAVMIAVWGLVMAGVPVGWSTWITRTIPDEPEAGGSLIVAAINFAIGGSAALGGIVLDAGGPRAVFVASFVILALAIAIITRRLRVVEA